MLACCGSSQVASFPKPAYFRQTFYKVSSSVELKDPTRLRDFVAGGNLELSLKSYLELVMANNTDIQIEMLSVETPKNAILRAMSTWDPTGTASFVSTRSKAPSVTQLSGANTSVSLSQPANFGFTDLLPTGTQVRVGFSASRNSNNSSFSTLNPYLNSGLAFSFSQPVLRNRGYYVTHLNLMIAKSRYRGSEYTLRAQLQQLVQNAELAYWDVIQARENLRVAESALKLAEDSLDLAQREFKLGARSQLDVYNPEQQRANAVLVVSQARFSLAQTENALRRQIGADLDPDLRRMPILLTENVDMPAGATAIDAEQAVQQALASRPEIKAAIQNLDIDDLSIRQARNDLLPSVSLTAAYTTQGIGGILNPYSATPIPGGFSDALSQMFGFGYPVYSFGLNIDLPIRSHAAAAEMADARVQKKRDALAVRSTQQQIRLNVLNAVNNVESSRKSVELALTAADFAAKYLDAENQKYQLGIDPMQFVLQAQNALTQAQSAVVQAQVGFRRNQLNLLTQTGQLLDERGIVVQ